MQTINTDFQEHEGDASFPILSGKMQRDELERGGKIGDCSQVVSGICPK
ncbi:MAG: hypothetical protein COB08_016505 [Rhodobacteraceae bacterium]|nr:hypothetical protein [Paracoccaceae bacterium]